MITRILNSILPSFTLMLLVCACKKELTITTREMPEINIAGNDSRFSSNAIHFVKDTVYVISSNVVIGNGQVFSIDAGTVIKVKQSVSITINPGGEIQANGEASQPVVFTTAAEKGSAGQLVNNTGGGQLFWSGLRMNGTSQRSSGSLKYVRIEFAGGDDFVSSAASVSLKNIDPSTTLDHLQVSYSYQTPSFYFSSGGVNASHLVSYASAASDFVFDNGYSGKLQFLIAYRHPYFSPPTSSGTTLAGIQIQGEGTKLVVSNFTVLGPASQKGTAEKYYDTTSPGPFGSTFGSKVAAMVITEGKFKMRNSILAGFPFSSLYLDNTASAVSLQQEESEFSYCVFESDNKRRAFYLPINIYPPYNSNDLREFLLRLKYNNQQFYDTESFGFTDPFNYDVKPDVRLKADSPLATGANFDGPVFNDPFFKQVPYHGAISNDDNWLQGWTNFLPLQTDYNP